MVFCEDDTCRHGDGIVCTRSTISIELEYGEMEQGHRRVMPTCQCYQQREAQDDGDK